MKNKIKEIFDRIDNIIKSNLNARPILFERSVFKKEYEKLKQEYLEEE